MPNTRLESNEYNFLRSLVLLDQGLDPMILQNARRMLNSFGHIVWSMCIDWRLLELVWSGNCPSRAGLWVAGWKVPLVPLLRWFLTAFESPLAVRSEQKKLSSSLQGVASGRLCSLEKVSQSQ